MTQIIIKIKKIIAFLSASAMIALSSVFIPRKYTTTEFNAIDLNTIEVLSNCEVSSNPADNGGYCSPIYGGAGDACTSTGDPGAVRCSGNF